MAAMTRPNSPKVIRRIISFIFPSINFSTKAANVDTNADTIDSFTNELIAKKSKKWENLQFALAKKSEDLLASTTFGEINIITNGVLNDLKTIKSPELGLDIRMLSQPQLDNLLMATVEIKNKLDFLYLIRQCIKWEQLPSRNVLVDCLKYLSSLGKIQQIDQMMELCKIRNSDVLKTYFNFAAFKAIAIWRNGNFNEAFKILCNGYGSCMDDEGRKMIRIAFKTMAEETLAKKTEAVLINLIQIAIQIYKDHRDLFVIACVWKNCFCSDWFCDQKSARKLFDEHEDLRALVSRRAPSICSSFLRQNNVDAVHRLIEAFLQYNQNDACNDCLSLLFNYQYYRNDLRACAEIVKSCSELKMPLSEKQNEQFLHLFLNQSESSYKSRKYSQRQFEYKF